MRLSGSRALAWFVPVYVVLLLLMASRLSLWLDEVLTMSGALQRTFDGLLVNLEKQQGATPLAFLVPRWAAQVLGFTLWSVRLPSILASAATVPAVFRLAQRAGVVRPLIAVLCFACWPLQVRYALEARPYAVAVCLTAWLMVAFLERRSSVIFVLLTVLLALTQPYALFVPAGLLAWSLWQDRARSAVVLTALVVSAAVLLPWYLHFQEGWRAMSARQDLSLFNWRAPLVFLREISGSGYFGTAVLGIGLWFARTQDRLWWVAVALPLIAVPAANVVFDYFFAVRQFIFLLPVLALLFVAGAERAGQYGQCCVLGFLIASLYADVTWFWRPREDWAAAADVAAGEASKGACVQFVGDSEKLFVVFHSELAQRACDVTTTRVVLAGSTYESDADTRAARASVAGWTKQSERTFVAPWVEVYVR